MSAVQTLKELIVKLCREDHVGLWVVLHHVRDAFPEADTAELREVTLGILDELLDRGEVQAGFPTRDGRGFDAWSATPAETIARVEDAWESLHRDPSIGEVVWFKAPSQNAPEDPRG